LTALACGLTQINYALAENPLEETIVTSSRIEMPLRQVGTSVSVLTLEDLRDSGFNSLHDALRTLPAIGVSNSGGPGSTTALRIRGEEGFRTRTYIDGIDISDTSAPQVGPRFEHLLTSGIERVEVLRGPQGLMYGADAGGIVNIFTRRATDDLTGSISAETGRYGTTQFAGDIAGGNKHGDFAINVADFSSDGFNARTDDIDLADDDGYDNTTFHGRFGWNASENLRLEAVLRDVDGEGEYDNCFSSVTFTNVNDCSNEYEQQAWRAAALLTTGALQHELAISNSDTERQFYTEGMPSFGAEGELERITYKGAYQISDSLDVIAGLERQTEQLDDGDVDRERDQDSYYLELQNQTTDSLFLTAGVRHDDNEDFGSHTTYRVSGAYVIALDGAELKLKSTYGTGFRAPSLYEISYNAGPNAFPPASGVSLDEEQSSGFDIGLVWATDSGNYLELVYFDQTIENEIFFDLDAFSGYLQGDGEADSSGVELIGEIQLSESFSLNGNYTYNDTERTDGSQRYRRPEHLANLELRWLGLGDKLRLSLHVRGSYDAVDSSGENMDDYEVLNLNAEYALTQGLSVYGRVENLLDEDYEEVPGYNTPGAAAYAGVRYSF
jgi:vitamin B12 transporter